MEEEGWIDMSEEAIELEGPEILLKLCKNSGREVSDWKLIENECSMIYNLGLKDYFLYIKKHKIKVSNDVNSWVAYLIGITDKKPTGPWKESRAVKGTLPDIDMDFQDDKRDELKEYLAKKWGQDKVSSLCVFAGMKGKIALQDVARAYEIPPGETLKASSQIVQRSGGDARSSQTIADAFNEFQECKDYKAKHPEVVKHASVLEGQHRHPGTHAAGIIISKTPINEDCPIIKVSDAFVTGYEGQDLELLGFTKFDILGLSTLTVVQRCLELLKRRRNIDVDLDKLPLDDKKVYEEFAKGNTRTVFQFESEGCKRMCRSLHIDNFDELVAANALNRPGPLRSGLVPLYCRGKHEKRIVKPLHPLVDEILKETYGVCLFQEQVMLILYKLGNFDWTSVSQIRHIISKRVGVEVINQYRDRFIMGAKKHGIGEDAANSIYNQIGEFGSYGFNKSHAAAYSILSYHTMFLKVYYPLEYMTIVLSLTKDKYKTIIYLDELRRMKVPLFPPNVQKSESNFSTDGKAIYYGLNHIKGVGDKASVEIFSNRPFRNFNDFVKKVNLRLVNARVVKSLSQVGAFESLGCNDKEIFCQYESQLPIIKKGKEPVFKKSKPWTKDELLQIRYNLLGLPFSEKHPSELFRKFVNTLSVSKRIIGTEQFFKGKMFGNVLLYGMILKTWFAKIGDFREAFGRPGEAYMRLSIDDGWDDYIFVVIPPWVYNERKNLLKVGEPVIIEGQKRGDGRMFASDICSVKTLKESVNNSSNQIAGFEKKLISHPTLKAREMMRLKGQQKGKSKEEWKLVSNLSFYKTGCLGVGLITKLKEHETKRGLMAFLNLDDEVSTREAVVFASNWASLKDKLKKDSLIAFRANLSSKNSIIFDGESRIKVLNQEDLGVQ